MTDDPVTSGQPGAQPSDLLEQVDGEPVDLAEVVSESTGHEAVGHDTVGSEAVGSSIASERLDALEADLAAVESAMATLDEIAVGHTDPRVAAMEIAAAVSPERFAVSEPVDHSGPNA